MLVIQTDITYSLITNGLSLDVIIIQGLSTEFNFIVICWSVVNLIALHCASFWKLQAISALIFLSVVAVATVNETEL
jgi:hypothetical protein